MLQDLKRPHRFAHERVGFLFIKKGTAGDDNLLLHGVEHMSVLDGNYIDDPDVGAKINSAAIRAAMERAMVEGYGIMHVHLHGKSFSSAFSRTDRREFGKLIPSFHNIGGGAIHGAAVLSGNRFTAFVLLQKNADPVAINKVTVIGYPVLEYVRERSCL